MNKNTQFVTCMFSYDEKSIDKWCLFIIPLLLYVPNEYVDIISTKLQKYTNIEIRATPPIERLPWYKPNLKLPSVRNEQKDTLEYIWHTHMKIVCLHHAMSTPTTT